MSRGDELAARINVPHRNGALAILMAAQFFYAWAWGTGDILRPQYRHSLGLSLLEAGSGYSVQVVGAVIGAALLTSGAHRWSRRAMTTLLLVGFGGALLAGAFVTNWHQFLLHRFVLGLFAGGVFPITVGYYIELFSPRSRGRVASAIDACYFGAIISLGVASGFVAQDQWRILLWAGALPALLLAPLAFALLPRDTRSDAGEDAAYADVSIRALFSSDVRRQTLMLTLMMGANAIAYQSFTGWLTTLLGEELGWPARSVGLAVGTLFAGNVVGTIVWGWLIDRYGRRVGGYGILACAALGLLFLHVPAPPPLLIAIAAVFGMSFGASVTLGPLIAELYPPHLRLAAMSIFQWGRLVSLVAPLATGAIAGFASLTVAVSCAMGAFLIGAAIWRSLPETLPDHPRTKRVSA